MSVGLCIDSGWDGGVCVVMRWMLRRWRIEGRLDLHGEQAEGYGDRHAGYTLPHAFPVEALPGGGEGVAKSKDWLIRESLKQPGEAHLDLLIPRTVVKFLLPFGSQARYALEAPFLKGDTTEGFIAVLCGFELPAAFPERQAFFCLLPCGPGAGGPVGGFVDVALLGVGDEVRGGFGVDEGAAGGDGEEEETHVRALNLDRRSGPDGRESVLGAGR